MDEYEMSLIPRIEHIKGMLMSLDARLDSWSKIIEQNHGPRPHGGFMPHDQKIVPRPARTLEVHEYSLEDVRRRIKDIIEMF
jgi:hypothetical protein